jgi:Tfp pilus assembly protein PilO
VIGNLSRRERTLVASGVLVALIVGGWELVITPILDRQRLAGEMVPAREQLLEHRRGLIARKAGFARELEEAGTRLDKTSARLLAAATPAVAASELQKLAKDTAALAKTEVRSERILPPVERGPLLEVPVEIAVSGGIRELVDFLARLDSAPKLLTVQEVRIRVVNPSQPRDLLATLTLSGFVLPAAART